MTIAYRILHRIESDLFNITIFISKKTQNFYAKKKTLLI